MPLAAALGHRHTAGAWVAALFLIMAFLAKRPIERALRGAPGASGVALGLAGMVMLAVAGLVSLTGFRTLPFFTLQVLLAGIAWLAGRKFGTRHLASELMGASALLAGGATVLAAGGAGASASLRFIAALSALALPPLIVLRRQVARASGRTCADPPWLPALATAMGLGIGLLYWMKGAACLYFPLWSALLALRAFPVPAPRNARILGYTEGLVQLGHFSAALWGLALP